MRNERVRPRRTDVLVWHPKDSVQSHLRHSVLAPLLSIASDGGPPNHLMSLKQKWARRSVTRVINYPAIPVLTKGNRVAEQALRLHAGRINSDNVDSIGLELFSECLSASFDGLSAGRKGYQIPFAVT